MALPDRFHIAWENFLNSVVITSSIEPEVEYPLANLLSQKVGDKCRFDVSGISPGTLSIKWSSSVAFKMNCFALKDFTMTEGYTINRRLFEGEDQTGTEHASGALAIAKALPWDETREGIAANYGHYVSGSNIKTIFTDWFDQVAVKSGQIDIAVPAENSGLLDIGKMFCSWAFSPADNYEWGGSHEIPNANNMLRGDGLVIIPQPSKRKLTINFAAVSDSDEKELMGYIKSQALLGKDLLVTLNPNATGWDGTSITSIYKATSGVQFTELISGVDHSFVLEEN